MELPLTIYLKKMVQKIAQEANTTWALDKTLPSIRPLADVVNQQIRADRQQSFVQDMLSKWIIELDIKLPASSIIHNDQHYRQ